MIFDPSRLTSRTLLGRLVRLPIRMVPDSAVMRVLSGPNKGARWRAGSSVAGCWVGTFESHKVRRLMAVIRSGMTVWDIGANAGYYTLLFSRLVGPTGRVFAFEPFAENAHNLLDHIAWNACGNTHVVQAAVAACAGLSGFEVGVESNSIGHLAEDRRGYLVPTVRLDDCISQQGFAVPDVIKMDIEGAEVEALRGSSSLLQTGRTTWYVSLHGLAVRPACWELFTQAGYRLSSLDGQPLPPRLEGFDDDEIIAHPPTTT